MKIAFLNIYKGLIFRGAERSIDELAARLSKNHKVVVFQGYADHSAYATIVVHCGRSFLTNNYARSFFHKLFIHPEDLRILWFTLRVFLRLFQEKYDVIIPTNGGWQVLLCRIIMLITSKKMIITGRAGPGWDDQWNLLMQPDIFIALSPANLTWAKNISPKIRIECIPNGVDLKLFSTTGKKAELFLEKPIIICVGALVPEKRHELVIQAVARIEDVSLLLVGQANSEYAKKIIAMGKVLLGKRFEHKVAAFDEMPALYRSANVFTLASSASEAFGNVYVEAMACGLPVVAPNDETRKFIVGNAGFFVDPENVAEYAQALQTASTTQFGDKPIRQAASFDYEEIVRRYEALFFSLR